MTAQLKAVLLLAFGGPQSLDEVEPFLRKLMAGRHVSSRQIEAVKNKYKLIGGISPLHYISNKQAEMLEKTLNEHKSIYRVFVGMRYAEPSVDHAVEQILSLDIHDILALPLSPYYSSISSGKYIERFEQLTRNKKLNVKVIKSYNTNSFLIMAIRQRLKEALTDFGSPYVIFSAHSLPERIAVKDGYVKQLEETLKLVVKDMPSFEYTLAFQSRGMTGNDWLGPDVKDVLDRCAENKKKNIVVLPYGFVSDHVETFYDIDIVYKQHADELGLIFKRASSLNTSALFIQALKDVVVKA